MFTSPSLDDIPSYPEHGSNQNDKRNNFQSTDPHIENEDYLSQSMHTYLCDPNGESDITLR